MALDQWLNDDAESRRARRISLGFLFAGLSIPATAFAHERFVKHRLKNPLDNSFFRQGDGPMGMHPDMLNVATRVFVITAAFMIVWYLRQPLGAFLQKHIRRHTKLGIQKSAHKLECFLTDRPVRGPLFQGLREWTLILFLRSPGLVLMFSATNDSLVMPSYPLDPASATIFKFVQVLLAILILTQTVLPLCGALIIGTWLYLFRWGWMVGMDAIPVLTVAVVYVTSPWQSHKEAIISTTRTQTRWIRLILGAGFVILGWLKIYNHDLVAGVADNFPSAMDDPMVQLLAFGTDPGLKTETWVAAFALAEVMSGFLLMIGVFSRIWAAIMAFMFTKLMLLDFGWDEIPHIYPIAGMLVIIFSNTLSSEIDPIEEVEERFSHKGQRFKQAGLIAGTSLLTAFLLIYPLLYYTTFLDRSHL